MAELSGKVAVITGGSRGIGFGCAERLAEEGADVLIAAISVERLAAAAQRISEATGRRVEWCATDLRTLDGCQAVASKVQSVFGGCDILVNNAGATKNGRFTEQPDEEWIDGFALKFFGAVRLTRLLWPSLRDRHGSVVNIVGGASRTPTAVFMVGGAVNAALSNFSKALADQGLKDDVSVNWVLPGTTRTERMNQQLAARAELAGKTVEEMTRDTLATQGLRRFGEPADVANMVAFLCSPRSRHVHGAGIAVDGGATKGVF
jgi:NAD(P)-dependent dehydrogenase (short-subunit alcohol dehydrogenase family)